MGKKKAGKKGRGAKGKKPNEGSAGAAAAAPVVGEGQIKVNDFLEKFGIAPTQAQQLNSAQLNERAKEYQELLQRNSTKEINLTISIIDQVNLHKALQEALDPRRKVNYGFVKFLFEASLEFYSQMDGQKQNAGTKHAKRKFLQYFQGDVEYFLNPLVKTDSDSLQAQILSTNPPRRSKIKLSELTDLNATDEPNPKITFSDASVCFDICETLIKSPIHQTHLEENLDHYLQLILFRAIIEDDVEAVKRAISLFCSKKSKDSKIDTQDLQEFLLGLHPGRGSSNLTLIVDSCSSGEVLELILKVGGELGVDPDKTGVVKMTPLHMAVLYLSKTYKNLTNHRCLGIPLEDPDIVSDIELDWSLVSLLLKHGCRPENIDLSREDLPLSGDEIKRAVLVGHATDVREVVADLTESIKGVDLESDDLQLTLSEINHEVTKPRFSSTNNEGILEQASRTYRPDGFAFFLQESRQSTSDPKVDLSTKEGLQQSLDENVFVLLHLASRMCDDSKQIDAIIAENFPERKLTNEESSKINLVIGRDLTFELSSALCAKIRGVYESSKTDQAAKAQSESTLTKALQSLNGKASLFAYSLINYGNVAIDISKQRGIDLFCESMHKAILQYDKIGPTDIFQGLLFQVLLGKLIEIRDLPNSDLLNHESCRKNKATAAGYCEDLKCKFEKLAGGAGENLHLAQVLNNALTGGEPLPRFKDRNVELINKTIGYHLGNHAHDNLHDTSSFLRKNAQEVGEAIFRSNKVLLRAIDCHLKATRNLDDTPGDNQEDYARRVRDEQKSIKALAVIVNHWSPCSDEKATRLLKDAKNKYAADFVDCVRPLLAMGFVKPLQVARFISKQNDCTLLLRTCLMTDPNFLIGQRFERSECAEGFAQEIMANGAVIEGEVPMLANICMLGNAATFAKHIDVENFQGQKSVELLGFLHKNTISSNLALDLLEKDESQPLLKVLCDKYQETYKESLEDKLQKAVSGLAQILPTVLRNDIKYCNNNLATQHLRRLTRATGALPQGEGRNKPCQEVADLAKSLNPEFETNRVNLVIYSLIANLKKLAGKNPDLNLESEERTLLFNISQITPLIADSLIFAIEETGVSPFENFIDDGKDGVTSMFRMLIDQEVDFVDTKQKIKLLKYFLDRDDAAGEISSEVANKVIILATTYFDKDYCLPILKRLFELDYELPEVNLKEGEFCPVAKILLSGSVEVIKLVAKHCKEPIDREVVRRICAKSKFIAPDRIVSLLDEPPLQGEEIADQIKEERVKLQALRKKATTLENDTAVLIKKTQDIRDRNEIEVVAHFESDAPLERDDAKNETEVRLKGVVKGAVQRVETRKETEAAAAREAEEAAKAKAEEAAKAKAEEEAKAAFANEDVKAELARLKAEAAAAEAEAAAAKSKAVAAKAEAAAEKNRANQLKRERKPTTQHDPEAQKEVARLKHSLGKTTYQHQQTIKGLKRDSTRRIHTLEEESDRLREELVALRAELENSRREAEENISNEAPPEYRPPSRSSSPNPGDVPDYSDSQAGAAEAANPEASFDTSFSGFSVELTDSDLRQEIERMENSAQILRERLNEALRNLEEQRVATQEEKQRADQADVRANESDVRANESVERAADLEQQNTDLQEQISQERGEADQARTRLMHEREAREETTRALAQQAQHLLNVLHKLSPPEAQNAMVTLDRMSGVMVRPLPHNAAPPPQMQDPQAPTLNPNAPPFVRTEGQSQIVTARTGTPPTTTSPTSSEPDRAQQEKVSGGR